MTIKNFKKYIATVFGVLGVGAAFTACGTNTSLEPGNDENSLVAYVSGDSESVSTTVSDGYRPRPRDNYEDSVSDGLENSGYDSLDSGDFEDSFSNYQNEDSKVTTTVPESFVTLQENQYTNDTKNSNSPAKTTVKTKPVVTSKTTVKTNPVVTSKTTVKTNPVVTSKTTVKTNASTTAKPVTTKITTKLTTTTTTEEPAIVTEPPVVEPELPPVSENGIGAIATDRREFAILYGKLLNDVVANSGYEKTHISIDVGYGNTLMGAEMKYILQALNPEISDAVIAVQFKPYSVDDLNDFKTFMFSTYDVLKYFNGTVDSIKWSDYIINPEVGSYLENANRAYWEGEEAFTNFMIDTIVNGNVSQDVLNNPGAMAILYSMDKGKVLNYDDIDNMQSNNINYICGIVNGRSLNNTNN